jgi:hypothetical protein
VPTGDGRQFSANALTWAETPLPLRWNIQDSHGGMPTTTTVLVGRIDSVWRDPANPMQIMGTGVFDDAGTNGAEALRLVTGKFLRGVSIDPDDISESDIEYVYPQSSGDGSVEDELAGIFDMPEMTIFHAGRLRAATLVDTPAFVEAQVWLGTGMAVTGGPPMPGMPQSVAASAHFGPLSDRSWNGPANEHRLPASLTARRARTAFAFVATSADDAKAAARFLHHEIGEDGETMHANLTACATGIRTINAGRAMTMSDADRQSAYEHMAQHLRVAGLTPPPYEAGRVITASSYAERPPVDWFKNPNFTELTPLTITDDGRVLGHGAAWGSCHTAFGDACVTPPAEPGGEHVYYRLGELVTSDGGRVAVGSITLGTGHAPTRNITSSQAAEHYDHTGTAVALVASGEDEFGIWVAGAVRPGTPEARVVELRGASLSGDWRRIGGALRLVAFLAVNRPGFPVPRTAAFVSKSNQMSLVAAGVVTQGMRPVGRSVGVDAALARIARSIGRDPQSRIDELKQRVRGV